ncbi:MAG: hypothetical protein EPO16_11600, partial [Dehalococcoidia bacterium]
MDRGAQAADAPPGDHGAVRAGCADRGRRPRDGDAVDQAPVQGAGDPRAAGDRVLAGPRRRRSPTLINKIVPTFDEAVSDIEDGATIHFGGFASPFNSPSYLTAAVARRGVTG